MPFTPFHFGPGYAVKSIFEKKFNFLAFVTAQVLIDCETAYNMLMDNHRLHTFLHTFLGSLAVIPAGYILILLGAAVAEKLNLNFFKKIFGEDRSPKIMLLSFFVGAWSHVFFDGIMHSDSRPFWPLDVRNVFLDLIDVGYLHILCFVCAAIGMFWANRDQFKKNNK